MNLPVTDDARHLFDRIIRSIRPILFQTDLDDFQYATHGGTVFVVEYKGRPYGITCKHVLEDFNYDGLVVMGSFDFRKGDKAAQIDGYYMQRGGALATDATAGSDVQDICIVVFAEETDLSFFGSDIYEVNERTVHSSQMGNELHVSGFLKDKTTIAPPTIRAGHALLQLRDAGSSGFDPFLRRAHALFGELQFDSLTGLSGAPAFNVTEAALCGMVVRAGLTGQTCWLYFLDIYDIVQMLEVASTRSATIRYDRPAMRW